jgi:hypothetical protein
MQKRTLVDAIRNYQIKRDVAKAKAQRREEQRLHRIESQRLWRQYTSRYWYVALVLHEAIGAEHSFLGVHMEPSPRLHMPTDTRPSDLAVFSYVLRRVSSDSEDYIHEQIRRVRRTLVDYFASCGFQKFSIACDSDSHFYRIQFRMDKGFIWGAPLSSRIGEIMYYPDYVAPQTGIKGRFDVHFFQGGFLGEIREGIHMEIYRQGIWHPTTVVFNHPFAMLGCNGEPLHACVGLIVRA